MSRSPRILFPGACYHITSRGNRRATIFLDDHDYLTWHEAFDSTTDKFGFICHSFCLMPNHFHILLETPVANLSEGMQYLNSHYSQHFNKRHERSGHVLQGRFNAELVDQETYFAELGRYITLNPVRAGLAKAAADWRWSSYRYTAGLATPPEWLEIERMLAHFGQAGDSRRFSAFCTFVNAGIGAESPLKKRRQCLSEQARQARTAPMSLADYAARPDREQAIIEAIESGAYCKKDIAEAFGINRKSVARARRRSG